MAITVSVYIATSLDGCIARPNGDIGWLTDDSYTLSGIDYGYQAFMDTVDVVVMGRGTFEKVLTFGAWPYTKPVIVLSHRLSEVPAEVAANVELLDLTPSALLRHLEDRGVRHIYVDGGKTIQRFLNEELIDELIITQIPILIGEGIPLFGPLVRDIRLQHVATETFANGFIQSRYRVSQ